MVWEDGGSDAPSYPIPWVCSFLFFVGCRQMLAPRPGKIASPTASGFDAELGEDPNLQQQQPDENAGENQNLHEIAPLSHVRLSSHCHTLIIRGKLASLVPRNVNRTVQSAIDKQL